MASRAFRRLTQNRHSLIQRTHKLGSLLLILQSLSWGSSGSEPLWPGSKYNEADRLHAMLKALDYIRKSADDPLNFDAYASDFVYCFYSIAKTARDPELRAAAARLAPRYARK